MCADLAIVLKRTLGHIIANLAILIRQPKRLDTGRFVGRGIIVFAHTGP